MEASGILNVKTILVVDGSQVALSGTVDIQTPETADSSTALATTECVDRKIAAALAEGATLPSAAPTGAFTGIDSGTA